MNIDDFSEKELRDLTSLVWGELTPVQREFYVSLVRAKRRGAVIIFSSPVNDEAFDVKERRMFRHDESAQYEHGSKGLLHYINRKWNDERTYARCANDFPLTSREVYDPKLEADLQAEREWRKNEPLVKNKDGHSNPNRVHRNSHSSKINNRERSRKKRQGLKKHRRR